MNQDLPPPYYSIVVSKRASRQLFLYIFLSVLLTALAIGLGIPLVGRTYNIDITLASFDLPNLQNGMFHHRYQLLGMYIQIYLGTLGLMLFGNFIPSFIVLQLSRPLYISIILTLLGSFLLAMALIMYFFIEPQKTFTDHVDVGANDPNMSTAGCFFFVGMSFLAGLCIGILRFQIQGQKSNCQSQKPPSKFFNDCVRLSVPPGGSSDVVHNHGQPHHSTSKFTGSWGLVPRFTALVKSIFVRGRRRAIAFVAFYVFLG